MSKKLRNLKKIAKKLNPRAKKIFKRVLRKDECNDIQRMYKPTMKKKIIRYLNNEKFNFDEFMSIIDPLPVSKKASDVCAIYHNYEGWWDSRRDEPVDSDWEYYNCKECGEDKTDCECEDALSI